VSVSRDEPAASGSPRAAEQGRSAGRRKAEGSGSQRFTTRRDLTATSGGLDPAACSSGATASDGATLVGARSRGVNEHCDYGAAVLMSRETAGRCGNDYKGGSGTATAAAARRRGSSGRKEEEVAWYLEPCEVWIWRRERKRGRWRTSSPVA
jgi:hypothetical protein